MTQYMESFERNSVNKEITDHKMNQYINYLETIFIKEYFKTVL